MTEMIVSILNLHFGQYRNKSVSKSCFILMDVFIFYLEHVLHDPFKKLHFFLLYN